jgi:cpsT
MILKESKYLIYDQPKKVGLKLFAKKIVSLLQRGYYKLIYYLCKPKKIVGNKYKVSICAIFKDEADYLQEWIEFHRIVGVEHFYLYNNNSSDNYIHVLKPYIDQGIVSLINWPKPQSQMEAYQDFMNNNASETEWVGFIDLDEYVIPNENSTIYDFLKKFKNRPAVIIYWKCFGTSGYIKRDVKRLITEDFVVAWNKYVDIGKFFFNTKYNYTPNLTQNNYMHYMWAKYKNMELPPVNVFDKVCTYGFNPVKDDSMPIQINHYLIKSYEEYTQKKAKRGGGVHPVGMHDYEYFYEHESKCQSTDYHAYKYLIKLKLAMKDK